jgi:intein/homing endonuclease
MDKIVALTKMLPDEFDEVDEISEACDMSPDFKQYYSENKDIVELAWRLRGKIKSQGQHAGGVIISSVPLQDTIPLSYINGKFVSQWTEGLTATQLSKFGLIKFDILGLTTLSYNEHTEQLIKETRGITIDWNDNNPSDEEPYQGTEIWPDGSKHKILMNDPKVLSMINQIKVDATFQFDTPVAKGVLANGVRNFYDIVNFTSLARPGPMECISKGSLVNTEDGYKKIEKLDDNDKILYLSKNGVKSTNKFKVFYNGKKKLKKITLSDGKIIICTDDHLVMTSHGFSEVKNIKEGDMLYVRKRNNYFKEVKIISIEEIKEDDVYDIGNFETDCYNDEGNFLCDDILVHNCIPEYVRRRDDFKQSWKKKEDPRVAELLEKTFGILCVHEDTFISMSDGREVKIKDVTENDKVFSVYDKTIRPNKIINKFKTAIKDGLKITLNNGYEIITSNDHKILTYYGYKEAKDLISTDSIAVASNQRWYRNFDINPWLGSNENIAYFLGILTGDGCLTGSSLCICVGKESDAVKLNNWISKHINITSSINFHCRAHYINFHNKEMVVNELRELKVYEDTKEWWYDSYNNATINHIAKSINRSVWYVYKKLHFYKLIGNRHYKAPYSKTKLHKFIEDIGLNKNCYDKRIPECIMTNSDTVRSAYLAGLIDSDGYIGVNKNGILSCHITSVNKELLNDIRKLCSGFNIDTKLYANRIYMWNTEILCEKINKYLVLKNTNGKKCSGSYLMQIPKNELFKLKKDMSYPEFNKKYNVNKSTFLNGNKDFIIKRTANKIGINTGDLGYYMIKNIEIVKNVQFYDINVENDHSFIGNGIVVHNCYQEQLTSFWTKYCGLTIPEAEKARKAVAKKKKEEVLKLRSKIVAGMIRNGFKNDDGPVDDEGFYKHSPEYSSAQGYWQRFVNFGRYAFNLSHAVAYSIIAYRTLWLKAYYPSEFWAGILTYCHPDRIPRYISIARSEGVKFKNIKTGNLRNKFTIDKDLNVYPSISMIKGIGDSAAENFSKDGGQCSDIDDFVSKYGKSRNVIERLIKLGAFDHIHDNRKSSWMWYLYKYGSQNDESKEIRTKIDNEIMAKTWPEKLMKEEIERQSSEFKKLYPKKKIPAKILNWKPKIGYKYDNPSRLQVMELFEEDFSFREKLSFEKEFLDMFLSNPLTIYHHDQENTFETCRREEVYYVDGVVEKWNDATTKNGKKFRNYYICDGSETNPIRIWEDSLKYQDKIVFTLGVGVRLSAQWSEKYRSYNLARNTSIILLGKKK